jgi:Cytochrome P450
MGKRIYIQTSIEDMSATYKAGPTISFDESVKDAMSSFGLSPEALALIWEPGCPGPFPNPRGKPFGQLSRDIQRQQLETPDGLAEVSDRFGQLLSLYLCPRGIPQQSIMNKTADDMVVDLMSLCQYTLVPVGTDTFFGKKLRTRFPDIDNKFLDFERNAWQLLFQLPPSIAKEMFAAKSVVTNALSVMSDASPAEKEDASWMMQTLDATMSSLGLSASDKGSFVFMLYWLINVNSYKLSFWMLGFILSSHSLLKEVRSELNSCVSADARNAPEPSITDLLSSCPTLNAVFDETLRITASAASTRTVTSDTVLNGRTYKAGSKILMPYRQLHFMPSTFGDSPYAFDHTRFLAKKNGLSKSPQFKPFGGGNTLCTGRFVARREVLLMVGWMLCRFDMKLCGGQTWPEMDLLKPGLGVLEPMNGQGLRVVLQEYRRSR